jgi:hypothetical protein
MNCRTALLTILDQVDYTNGACGVTEMVGAVLPKEIIALARKAIADEAAGQADMCPACFGDCERLHNDGLMHKCRVCNGTGKRPPLTPRALDDLHSVECTCLDCQEMFYSGK